MAEDCMNSLQTLLEVDDAWQDKAVDRDRDVDLLQRGEIGERKA